MSNRERPPEDVGIACLPACDGKDAEETTGFGSRPESVRGAACPSDPATVSRRISSCRDVVLVDGPLGIVIAVGRDHQIQGVGPDSREADAGAGSDVSVRKLVQDATGAIEGHAIAIALEFAGGNRARAAKLLGMSRQSLYVKMRRLGLGVTGRPGNDLGADDGA